MSVVWAHELAAGRRGGFRLAPARNWIMRTYTRKFQVLTNSRFDASATIAASGFVPSLMDPYIAGNDVDIFAVCTDVEITQPDKFQLIWDVTATYEGADNPLTRPHIVSVGKLVRERIVWQDVWRVTPAAPGQPSAPVPIMNSAHCYFDPPPTVERTDSTFSIQRNEPIFVDPIDVNANYADTINADIFMGLPVGTVKCRGVTGSDVFECGIWYWNLTYEFEYRPEGWVLWLLDQGLMVYTSGTDQAGNIIGHRKIKDLQNGGYISEPVPLDGTGQRLSATIANPQPKDFVFLSFNVLLSQFYAPLGLP